MGPGGDSRQYDLKDREHLHQKVLQLVDNVSLRPYDDMIFNWCDGDDSRWFSDVRIDIKKRLDGPNVGVELGDLYDMRSSIIENPEMAEYISFLDFLKDSDQDAEAMSKVFSSKKPRGPSESEIVVTLAVHLFAKIAPKSKVLVDVNMQDRPKDCPCQCGGTYQIGHLGIGSGSAWHGRPDMEIGSVVVSVAKEDDLEEEKDETSEQGDGPSPAKKQKEEIKPEKDQRNGDTFDISVDCKKGSISTMDVICQTAAQVITNTYAQVRANEALADKFIPAMLCSPEGIRIFVYNKSHDLLLYTHKKLALLKKEGKDVHLNLAAALEIWLAIHVQVVGCSANQLSKATNGQQQLSKCGFKRMMEERNAIASYENAKRHLKDFEEKKPTHFEDLYSPFGRVCVQLPC